MLQLLVLILHNIKNRDELIRDVEVKYPQKKAVAAEIEVSVDDEEFDEFPMRKAKIKT